MASQAVQEARTPSSTASKRKRAPAPTTDGEHQAKKKTRTDPDSDSALKLALDHLRMDPTHHPLYERNAGFILGQTLGKDTIQDAIAGQMDQMLALSELKKAELDTWGLRVLRRQLVLISAQRILEALGVSLNKTFHFSNMTSNFEIEQSSDDFNLSFVIKPVVQLDDDSVGGAKRDGRVVESSSKKGIANGLTNGSVASIGLDNLKESYVESENDSEEDSEDSVVDGEVSHEGDSSEEDSGESSESEDSSSSEE